MEPQIANMFVDLTIFAVGTIRRIKIYKCQYVDFKTHNSSALITKKLYPGTWIVQEVKYKRIAGIIWDVQIQSVE